MSRKVESGERSRPTHLVRVLLLAAVPQDRQHLEEGEDKLGLAHQRREVSHEDVEVLERDVSDLLEAMSASDEEFLELVRDGGWDRVSESLLGELVSV